MLHRSGWQHLRIGLESIGARDQVGAYQGLEVCVETGRETAGPSTALRSGRDDNSVASKWLKAVRRTASNVPQNCHPDRSERRGGTCCFRFSKDASASIQ